jgi:hypothetical protein
MASRATLATTGNQKEQLIGNKECEGRQYETDLVWS